MNIYLDFDGTVVTHEYPEIGVKIDGVLEVIDVLYQLGYTIVLNTYRADLDRGYLQDAVDYLDDNNIPYHRVSNLKVFPKKDWKSMLARPEEGVWIDDITKGIPLLNGSVNWEQVEKDITGILC